jgi:hypothetical protein
MKARTALGLALLLVLSSVGVASAADLDLLRRAQLSPVVKLPLGGALSDLVTSDNVEYIGTIPLDAPGIGGELVEHADGNRYFYATGAKGLTIYDVADPASPTIVSVTPFPHAQNEDLKVSDDGTRAVIAADGAIAVPVMPLTTGIHVFDTSDAANPELIASTNPLVMGGVGTGPGEHTALCADPACEWIYGSTSGQIYDATQADEGIITNTGVHWNLDFHDTAVGGRHALNRDASGLIVSDSNPRLVLDVTGEFGEGVGTYAQPELIAVGPRDDQADGRLQHNNVRPDSGAWEPRAEGDEVEWVEVDRSDAPANVVFAEHDEHDLATTRPLLRDGEILIGNAETNLNQNCARAGGLSTWSMADFDKGADMFQLEVFRPLNGTLIDGNPPANGLGCSGHWFTENDGIVAASWYEHGVRFFDVDKTTGAISQLGFFQPGVTEAGAAYWIDDEHVYSMDYVRGLDILRFDREGAVPTQERFDRSWLANLDRVGAVASLERLLCRLGVAD